jgi:2-keto-4-pentenoate hydratase/2-oxohepta-3-ene-1,7-dioic acid hydratase in catechol pathway
LRVIPSDRQRPYFADFLITLFSWSRRHFNANNLLCFSVYLVKRRIFLKTIVVANRAVSPSKIVCVGRNYIEHIEELNNEVPDEPIIFLKPNSAISGKLCSFHREPLHYEGEICLLFEDGRFSAVGFGLDITKRTLQKKLKSKGLPWERCKAFDGSAVFSRFIEIDKVSQNLSLELSVNGRIVQSGNISLMMYKPDDILVNLSSFMSLNNGDIVMTGTPRGVGVINAGDIFSGKIMNNGSLITSAEWLAI